MARAATIEPTVRMVALAFGLGASVALTVQQATPTALGHKLKAGNEMVDARLQKTFRQVRSLALTHQLRNLRQKALDRRCRRCFENQPRMGWPELRSQTSAYACRTESLPRAAHCKNLDLARKAARLQAHAPCELRVGLHRLRSLHLRRSCHKRFGLGATDGIHMHRQEGACGAL